MGGSYLCDDKRSAVFEQKTGSPKDRPKNILRIALSFPAWSFAYAVLAVIQNPSEMRGGTIIKKIFVGHYHMRFLFVIAGLYMIVPFYQIFYWRARQYYSGSKIIPYPTALCSKNG